MHPAIARFVPQSASDTMSTFATNLANLARSKLRDACSSGARDNISLHRWVLLKNSITTQDVQPDQSSSSQPVINFADDVSESPRDSEPEFEDEEVDSIIDEGMFAFLFPDPGDAVATPIEDECASEEQWLDSLLESLGDDEDDDDDDNIKVHIKPVDMADADAEQLNAHSRAEAEAESLCASCSEEFAAPPSPINVPYSVSYSPLNRPFKLDSHACCFASDSDSSPYSHFDHHDIEDSEGSVPDAIEDTSDDESESVSTPFSRSRTSLNLVDPASVPLPRDRDRDRYEPHIYRGSSSDDDYYPYEVDPLPYSDHNSESTAVYSPYHQSC